MKTELVAPEMTAGKSRPLSANLSWRAAVAQYQQPTARHSIWQLANTFLPFILVLALMYLTLDNFLWLTLALAPIAAGLQIRIFIFFHDCGHGSFFKSRRVNKLVGYVCGAVCFTPYDEWWHGHALHHATSGNLDKRTANQGQVVLIKKFLQEGHGLMTLTVPEYQQMNWWRRLFYRIYRHPLFLFGLVPPVQFLLIQRFPSGLSGSRERRSVGITNLTLLAVSVLMCLTVGWMAYLIVSLLVFIPTTIIGVWLFYIQHQFEDTYWKSQDEWKYDTAALTGSSYYKLPKVLEWFSGSIGYHHVHHLSPRIPNYYLADCHASHQLFQEGPVITMRGGLKSLRLTLWDTGEDKLVSFKTAKSNRIAARSRS